ncbi:MAG: two-component system response regulator [Gammaproteobacteria bacterium]|nr:MAG: two-component system response regulator [Gammaproteobacteria bacterium]
MKTDDRQLILVIDDSPTEAQLVTKILERASFRVKWAKDAASGVTMAQQLLPDLILMDVVMPGMNGFQATRRIARGNATKHIPIIMLTTKDQETDKIWGIRQGASDYLIKPADSTELLSKIRMLIKH